MRAPVLKLARGMALTGAVFCGVICAAMPVLAATGEPLPETAAAQPLVDSESIINRGPRFFEEYATPDNPDAAFFAGYAYIMKGYPDRAYSWIHQAAMSDTGLVDAWYFMGYLYAAGMTPEGRNLKTSRQWFEKAARKGHLSATNQLYFLTLLGTDGTPAPDAAYLLATAAADKGNAPALNNLGVMNEFGIGTQQNIAAALDFYQRAADAGNPSAHFNLGRLYESGKGVEKNIGLAAQSYLIAADLGYGPAQYHVGEMMRDGIGFTQNYFSALEWFTQAARQMIPEAMYEAGLMYAQGKGTTPNIVKAQDFFNEAVNVGHLPSIMQLGEIKSSGIQSTEDLRQAYSWYHFAFLVAKDDAAKNAAMDAREHIAESLDDKQRASARRQAELRRDNVFELQDKFQSLADGVGIDMFANPVMPRGFPVAMLKRALHTDAPADNKN